MPQPKTTCSYAVVNFITHTGQINYFALHCAWVNTAGLLLISVVHLGTEPWLSCGGSQEDSKLVWEEDPEIRPKPAPFVRFLGRPNVDTRGEELVIVLRLYLSIGWYSHGPA